MSNTTEEDVVISASQLGTKDYWDSRYEMELENFKDCGDEGEVWFGKSAENRIVKYLLDSKVDKASAVLDLGCGNGSVLRRLRAKGFSNLVGVDYCAAAVKLAVSVAAEEAEENNLETEIKFEVLDILSPDSRETLSNRYAIVLDKGTWDAMSLSDERESRRIAYLSAALAALAPQGKLVIFSCNFTKDELRSQFEGEDLVFECDVPATHVITFGGQSGVTSTGLVFTRT